MQQPYTTADNGAIHNLEESVAEKIAASEGRLAEIIARTTWSHGDWAEYDAALLEHYVLTGHEEPLFVEVTLVLEVTI